GAGRLTDDLEPLGLQDRPERARAGGSRLAHDDAYAAHSAQSSPPASSSRQARSTSTRAASHLPDGMDSAIALRHWNPVSTCFIVFPRGLRKQIGRASCRERV